VSCLGTGYLSNNELVPFPFEDGQTLPWACFGQRQPISNFAQTALQRCFVDAGIFVRSDLTEEGWPSIGEFSISPASQTIGFTISAAGCNSRLYVSSSSDRFPVASGSCEFGSYVIVLSSEGVRDFIEFCESNNVSPPSQGSSSISGADGDFYLRLCAKCVTGAPIGLSSIKVYDGVRPKSEGPHFVLRGDISIVPGNNMTVSDPDGYENGVALAAVPGSGMGVVPCGCEIGTVQPSPLSSTDGHIRIFNDTCYDLEPLDKVYRIVGGEARPSRNVKIHSKCTACCQCSMYESIVNDRLVPLAEAIRDGKKKIGALLSAYEDGVKKFNLRMSRTSLSDISMSMTGMPTGRKLGSKLEESSVKGRMNRCAFSVIVKNSSFNKVSANIVSLSGTDVIVEATASWSDKEGAPLTMTSGSPSGMVGKNFDIYPGRSLVITFVSSRMEMSSSVSEFKYIGSASVSFSYKNRYGASRNIGTLRRSVEV